MRIRKFSRDSRLLPEIYRLILRSRVIWALLAGLGLLMPQAGWSQVAAPIRIGATVSLSGKFMEPSLMVRDAMRLWERQVNERGGLLGRPVQLIFYDDQSLPERARKLYHQLIEKDKVDLVFSPYGTVLNLAASEVSEQHKMVMLTASASGNHIWRRGYKYIFGIHAPSSRYLIGFLDLAARQGLNTVAILYEETPAHIDIAQGARDWAQRLGLKISYFQPFRQGKEKLPNLLKECLSTRAEGLILCSYPEDSYILLGLLQEAQWRPQAVCLTIAPSLPSFYEKGGRMAEGIFGPSQWEPDIRIPFPGTKEFKVSFTGLAQRPPSYHAGSAYAACQIMEKGINHNRSLNQDKLREYILSLDTVTIVGRFRVDSTGRQVGHNPLLIQWQYGKKEIVYPTSLQTAPPRF